MNGHLCSWGEQCAELRKWHNVMNRRVRVYDNGGATVDRYTVQISRTDKGARVWDVYTMSDDPAGYMGVNMYSHTQHEAVRISGNEKRRRVIDLPEAVRKAIEERI